MAAADPATLTGTITIQTSVEDASSPEGFGHEIASANCAIDTATTASTDAAGVVTFAGLALTNDEGADCTYDVTALERDGYDINTSATALTALSAGTTEVVPSTVQLTDSTGVLGSPTRNPETNGNTLAMFCLGGENTAEMRAGRDPFTQRCTLPWDRQSGLGYAAAAGTPFPLEPGSRVIG